MPLNHYYEDPPPPPLTGHAIGTPVGTGPEFPQTGGSGGSGGGLPLPSGSVPNAHLAVPPNIGSQGISQLPFAAPGSFGTGAAGAAAGGAGLANSLLGGLQDFITNPNNLAGLAAVIAGLMSGGGNNQNTEEARRMQQITEARMRRVDPLHQAVTQLAFSRLPMNARQGVNPPQISPLP